jgi:hypothetical protein
VDRRTTLHRSRGFTKILRPQVVRPRVVQDQAQVTARFSRNVEALEKTAATGSLKYVARWVKDKVLSGVVGRLGFWRKVWQ